MRSRVEVSIEETARKSFASAADWPGWSRAGRTPQAALEAVVSYAPRYATVAAAAGEPFPTEPLEVVVIETHPGDASTEFGVPGRVSEADRRPTTPTEADRLGRLVAAAWAQLDAAVAAAPEALRKGPRGGGRDRSKVVEHVVMAEHAYAGQMGVRLPAPSPAEPATVRAMREAMLEVLRTPSDGSPLAGRRWTVRYAAHRIAWHALDHAWEIADRTEPGTIG